MYLKQLLRLLAMMGVAYAMKGSKIHLHLRMHIQATNRKQCSAVYYSSFTVVLMIYLMHITGF